MEPEAPPEVEPVMLDAGVELATVLAGVPMGVGVGISWGLIVVVKGGIVIVGIELTGGGLTAVDDVVATMGAGVS